MIWSCFGKHSTPRVVSIHDRCKYTQILSQPVFQCFHNDDTHREYHTPQINGDNLPSAYHSKINPSHSLCSIQCKNRTYHKSCLCNKTPLNFGNSRRSIETAPDRFQVHTPFSHHQPFPIIFRDSQRPWTDFIHNQSDNFSHNFLYNRPDNFLTETSPLYGLC